MSSIMSLPWNFLCIAIIDFQNHWHIFLSNIYAVFGIQDVSFVPSDVCINTINTSFTEEQVSRNLRIKHDRKASLGEGIEY